MTTKIAFEWALGLSTIGYLARAQGPPGPRWVGIQSGKTPWYTSPDSIETIGDDAYRVVFLTEPTAGLRDLFAEEIPCANHTRVVRPLRVTKRPARSLESTSRPVVLTSVRL
jgi:hypothetical protein